MTRLRSSTFALRATADRSSFGAARGAGSPALRRMLRACRSVAKRRRAAFAPEALWRAFTTAAAVMIGGSSSVFACPVCFGAEESSMIDATKLGVFVMLGITLVVQGGFVGFFLYLRKRAKRIADVELDTEWSELQGASRT